MIAADVICQSKRQPGWQPCGASNPAGSRRCRTCRAYLPGHDGGDRRTHGLRARNPIPSDLRDSSDEVLDGLVSDLGGMDAMTTLERLYARRLVDVDISVRVLMTYLAREGIVTPTGRVRDAYDKLLSGVALFDRLAQRLGLQRRQRPVDVLDAFEWQAQDANGNGAGGATEDGHADGQ